MTARASASQHLILLFAVSGLSACASVPRPPFPVTYSYSEDVRRRVAAEPDPALQAAARSEATVTRHFRVGFERHHGLYLLPVDRRGDLILPDILDDTIRTQIYQEMMRNWEGTNVPRSLLCICTGVEWGANSTRFLIRSIELRWVD